MNLPGINNAHPDHIGQYQLISVLGRGGMGIVYLARDTRLDRQVAIKCLRTELFESHYIERFKREALLLAKLNHPNIVQIYDFIESPEQLALVMEYVDGDNLHKRLREQLVPMQQRLRWLTQITQGLAVAHDAGIIHRDLKAENILLNKRNDAKISDLGIAKSQDFNATLTDHVAGSYCSMSPEQAMGESLDFKSDLFSLGILAYQLLCGAHPFGDTSNKLQVMQRIISHPPIPPQKHNPSLPVEICNLLGQLLSKNPENRPDNTGWVAAEFERLSLVSIDEHWGEDETQALTNNNVLADLPNKGRKLHNTGEHPTFDTRFTQIEQSPRLRSTKLLSILLSNWVISLSAITTLLILSGFALLQLRTAAPIYIAVAPPIMTTSEMPTTQQESIKTTINTAIQQGIIQLSDLYLIPSEEIATTGNNANEIRLATKADEVITTEINCKIESCTLTIKRLSADANDALARLKIISSQQIDLLTDNYLSIAEITERSISSLFKRNIHNSFNGANSHDYEEFLSISHAYRNLGESPELLTRLDKLSKSPLKNLGAMQSLYCQLALDLFVETKESKYLTQAETFLNQFPSDTAPAQRLINSIQIQIMQEQFAEAQLSIEKLSKLTGSTYLTSILSGQLYSKKQDYISAIKQFKNALEIKKTANAYYQLSITAFYSGNVDLARQSIGEALKLSPSFYNALSFDGTISLLEGDLANAISSFEKIRAQTPDDTFNLSNLGLALMLSGKLHQALDLFSKSNALAPHNPMFILNRADTLELMGNKAEAKKDYLTVIEETKTNSSIENLQYMAQAFAHLNQLPEALKTLKKLEIQDPQSVTTIYTSAIIHTLAHDVSSAILNIDFALNNGMSFVWFNLPWFDSLCTNNEFQQLMQKYKAPQRCATKGNN